MTELSATHMGEGAKETGLRKALRKWVGRLRTPSRPTTSTNDPSPPPPVPPILFTPTTQTIISSPADPRNSPPNTIKKLRMARRNTAPANYFAITPSRSATPTGYRSRDVSASRLGSSRSPSASRSPEKPIEGVRNDAAPAKSLTTSTRRPADLDLHESNFAAPLNTVTTMITATHPHPLRRRKSRLRLSFSRPPPVVDTRPRAVSAQPNSSVKRQPHHAKNDSKNLPDERPPSTSPEDKTTSTPDSEQILDPATHMSPLEELRLTARPYVDSDEENADADVERMDSPQDVITKQRSKEEEKMIDRKRREQEIAMSLGDVRMGMMV